MISFKPKYLALFTTLPAILLTALALADDTDATDIEEMTISASRLATPLRQTGSSVSVLVEQDLQLTNPADLADALQRLPSVSVSRSGGPGTQTSVRIRGEEAHRTTVIYDGINLNDGSGPQPLPRFEHLGSSTLERVEVLRGPQGVMYGSDAGGVVSLYSKRDKGADLSLEGGRYGSSLASGSLRGGDSRLNYTLALNAINSDGFNATSADTSGERDGYDNTSTHLRSGAALGDKGLVSLVYHQSDASSDYDNCYTASFSPSNNCQADFSQRAHRIAVEYRGALDQQLAFSRNATVNDNKTLNAGDASNFQTRGEISEWQYRGQRAFGDRQALSFGLSQTTYQLDTDGNADGEVEQLSREQLGVYAEARQQFNDRWFANLGLRSDELDDSGNHLSYRLSSAYIIPWGKAELRLKAAYATGFRAPSLYEMAYNDGPFAFGVPSGDELVEEESRGGEFGLEIARDDAQLSLVAFETRIENEIYFDLINYGGYLQSPNSETLSRGLELSGEKQLAFGLALSGNYTYNPTELSDDAAGAGAVAGGQRARRPQNTYNLALAWQSSEHGIDARVAYRHASNAVDYAFGQRELDNYGVTDIYLSWALNDAFSLYSRVENAFDQRYQTVPGFNSAGRAVYAGVKYAL